MQSAYGGQGSGKGRCGRRAPSVWVADTRTVKSGFRQVISTFGANEWYIHSAVEVSVYVAVYMCLEKHFAAVFEAGSVLALMYVVNKVGFDIY